MEEGITFSKKSKLDNHFKKNAFCSTLVYLCVMLKVV